MPIPSPPFPGMVIRYGFLWSNEHAAGRPGAIKDRPCAVIMAAQRQQDGRFIVRVAPITHSRPDDGRGIEIPARIKRHLGLDSEASWIVLDELNQFVWPGVDLRPIRPGVWSYGVLPQDLFDRVRREIRAVIAARRARVVPRTE